MAVRAKAAPEGQTAQTRKKAPAKSPRKGTAAPRADWHPKFLAELAVTCNVTEAARVAGASRPTVYEHKKKDPAFSAAWDDAVDEGVDALELECRRRALHGVTKPIFYQGMECGSVQEYSDTLAIFLLKAHRPKVYRENVDVTTGGQPIGTIPIREVIVNRPAPADE